MHYRLVQTSEKRPTSRNTCWLPRFLIVYEETRELKGKKKAGCRHESVYWGLISDWALARLTSQWGEATILSEWLFLVEYLEAISAVLGHSFELDGGEKEIKTPHQQGGARCGHTYLSIVRMCGSLVSQG